MLGKIFPWLLIGLALWYLPDIYLFANNASNALFKEAIVQRSARIEVKVVKPQKYLPVKYAVLFAGVEGLRIELFNGDIHFEHSQVVKDGSAIFDGIALGTYDVRVGAVGERTDEEIREFQKSGESVFENRDLLATTVKHIEVKGDTFVVPILQ